MTTKHLRPAEAGDNMVVILTRKVSPREAVEPGEFHESVSQEFERAEMEMTLSHKRRMLDLEYDTAQKKALLELRKWEAEALIVQSGVQTVQSEVERRTMTLVSPLVLSLSLDFLEGRDLSQLILCSRTASEMFGIFQKWREIPYDLKEYKGNRRIWKTVTWRMLKKSIHARSANVLRVPRKTLCKSSMRDLLTIFLPRLEVLDLTSCSHSTLFDVFYFMTATAMCAPRLHTILPPGEAYGFCSRRVSMICNPVLMSQIQISWPPHHDKCFCTMVNCLRDRVHKIGI